jgi:GT2 family glycosyltransferase
VSAPILIETWSSDDETAVSANARLAKTDATHVLWLQSPARLAPGALALLGSVITRFDPDLLYGDSTVNATDEVRVLRPAFSPLRLREQNYLGPVVVMSVAWMGSVGGFDPAADGIHGYDFALRYDGAPERVVRVPEVLSVLPAVESPHSAEPDAVTRALAARAVRGSVERREDGSRRVRYDVIAEPLVSVIIPTRGSSAEVRGSGGPLVTRAVRGLVESTSYPNIEIVIVADDETPQRAIDEVLATDNHRVRLVRYSRPFNFSAKINAGAIHASGRYLLLLNDDVEVIESDWLGAMLGLAQQPGVGVTGALLFFEDGTVQHAGQLYQRSWAGHIGDPGHSNPPGSFGITREVSGVTAACALLSADDFWRVGGMSPDLPGNFNDVDLCLKLGMLGRSAVFTPDAKLFHFESKTRDATVQPWEIQVLRERWNTRLLLDPYWNDSARP